jgi:hypothetical protein
MQYKSSFRPFELLHGDGVWRGAADGSAQLLAVDAGAQ